MILKVLETIFKEVETISKVLNTISKLLKIWNAQNADGSIRRTRYILEIDVQNAQMFFLRVQFFFIPGGVHVRP